MKARIVIEWRDMWIGAYWDRRRRILYLLPLPCIGLAIEFAAPAAAPAGPRPRMLPRLHHEHGGRLIRLYCDRSPAIMDGAEAMGLSADLLAAARSRLRAERSRAATLETLEGL